jgi:DNA polymerase-3 subunit gamma/tau
MTLALARKWRPKTFDEMVGQEHVVRALTNALAQNRLHHAYLMTGTAPAAAARPARRSTPAASST